MQVYVYHFYVKNHFQPHWYFLHTSVKSLSFKKFPYCYLIHCSRLKHFHLTITRDHEEMLTMHSWTIFSAKQESILVGCVPPALVDHEGGCPAGCLGVVSPGGVCPEVCPEWGVSRGLCVQGAVWCLGCVSKEVSGVKRVCAQPLDPRQTHPLDPEADTPQAQRQTPPCEQKESQMLVKILPCPKLCLRVVIM